MIFAVVNCSPEEYTKADLDPQYTPREHIVGYVGAANWKAANKKVSECVDRGVFERGCGAVEVK